MGFGIKDNTSQLVRWRQKVAAYSWFTQAIIALAAVVLWLAGGWEPFEQLAYNGLFQSRYRLFPASSWDDRLAVIAIDDKSLQTYGHFQSWRRDRYTKLLQILSVNPPAALGFDLIFSEPSPDDTAFAREIAYQSQIVLATAVDSQNNELKVVPELSQVAWLGHVVNTSDSDGITRQAALTLGNFPSLGLVLTKVYAQASSSVFLAQSSSFLQQNAEVWLNWPAPTSELKTYSFADILAEKVDPQDFTDKIVVIGITATAFDPLRTPFEQNPPTSGVYLQAAIIDNLLNKRFLYRLPDFWTVLLLIGLVPLTFWKLAPYDWQHRLIILGLMCLTGWIVIFSSFSLWGWWLPSGAILGTIALSAIGLQWREQQEKQQLMGLFSQHIAPELAQTLWQRRVEILEEGQLTPQEVTATVLFADIRGFTGIAELLSPQALLQWLNCYLDTMADCLIEHDAVIDKYMGDGIMAVFGIPFPRSDESEIRQDAFKAVAAGLAMSARLGQLNRSLQAQGKPRIEIGIGIHTGTLVVGSVGGQKRLNYSVIGDTVNVAARLENMTKTVRGKQAHSILVSQQTWVYVSDRFVAESVGSFQLRGRQTPTTVYAIVGSRFAPS